MYLFFFKCILVEWKLFELIKISSLKWFGFFLVKKFEELIGWNENFVLYFVIVESKIFIIDCVKVKFLLVIIVLLFLVCSFGSRWFI